MPGMEKCVIFGSAESIFGPFSFKLPTMTLTLLLVGLGIGT